MKIERASGEKGTLVWGTNQEIPSITFKKHVSIRMKRLNHRVRSGGLLAVLMTDHIPLEDILHAHRHLGHVSSITNNSDRPTRLYD